jgi:acyl carrier protein
MERNEVISRIETIVITTVNHHNFMMNAETRPENITGWDSLSNAMILTSIEAEFGIKFKFAEMISWKTVGELADIVITKIG